MFKNLAITLLIATVAAQDADFVNEAATTNAINSFGEPAGLAQASLTQSAAPALAAKSSTSAYGSAFVTPKLSGAKWDHAASVNYFVPNFGEDRDMLATKKHIQDSEKKLKHKWNPKKNAKSPPTDYFVPNFGLDRDILAADASINSTEKKLKHKWTPKQDADGQYVVPQAYASSSYSYN